MRRWPLRTEIQIVRESLRILESGERRSLVFLIPATMAVALLELAGMAALAPFIALLADPKRFENHRVLRWAYRTFGFSSSEGLFFFLGIAVLMLLIVSNATAAMTTWATFRFAWMRNATLSTRLLRSYLYRPYPFFLERNAADLMRKSLTDVQSVAIDVIGQAISAVGRLFTIAVIGAALFFIEPMLACGAILVFGGMYGTLFFFSRRWATNMGSAALASSAQRFKIAAEALVGVKEIKLYRLEEAVLKRFGLASTVVARNATNQQLLVHLPRYALDAVAFAGVLGTMLYLLESRHTMGGAFPLLGLYAYGTIRLLPALQGTFGALNGLRYNASVVATVGKEFDGTTVAEAPDERPQEPLAFEREVRIEDLCFSYVRSPRPVLERVSLTLGRGEWVSIVGPTGSGKSTLVDIALGLLEATSGRVLIDDVPLTRNRVRAWQAQTAYVPQQIFLVNDTVEANICFGIAEDKVDRARMVKAAEVAQIHDFVSKELPNGYQSIVGDRGVRLSGGQRQRIGVARALYRLPKFLVLDEATSALDGDTESEFFRALRAQIKDCTVISITHRLTTTRYFDRVYRIEAGTLVGEVADRDVAAAEAVNAGA